MYNNLVSLSICIAYVPLTLFYHLGANASPSTYRNSHDIVPRLSTYGNSLKDQRLTVLNGFEAYLEKLLDSLRSSLSTTYLAYAPNATMEQLNLLFESSLFRNSALTHMRTSGIRWPGSDYPIHWDHYTERFRNHDLTKNDLIQVRRHHNVIRSHVDGSWNNSRLSHRHSSASRSSDTERFVVRDIVIAAKGDTILSFSSKESEIRQVLRFRVLSHMLVEVSPYFSKILSCSLEDAPASEKLFVEPPQPDDEMWDDGSIVKVYDMPQDEHNKYDSLSTLLHAAHMHTGKIPRQIPYHEFVSIAETCSRYQCTSPLEMVVEHRWLPQWLHRVNDEYPDGMVLISYVFGIRHIFRRTTKSMILNMERREDLMEGSVLPPEVIEKIDVMRTTKLAQIYAVCAEALQEYYRSGTNVSPGADGSVPGWGLSSKATCLRGSHHCDAINLGWILLVFGELGILAAVMDTIYRHSCPPPPHRSIQHLVDGLRNMPSAGQIHDSACDHIPALRKAMADVYNSISGLTFWDVCGKGGWALSREFDTTAGSTNNSGIEIFELPVPGMSQLVPSKDSAWSRTLKTSVVALRIMSHLDTLKDLHAAAVINRSFHAIYKENELGLMKLVIAASKKRASPLVRCDTSQAAHSSQTLASSSLLHSISRNNLSASSHYQHKATDFSFPEKTSDDDLYLAVTPLSPSTSTMEVPTPTRNIHEVLQSQSDVPHNDQQQIPDETEYDLNTKYLFIDGVQLYKSLVVEDEKHMQQESDEHLRRGFERLGSSFI